MANFAEIFSDRNKMCCIRLVFSILSICVTFAISAIEPGKANVVILGDSNTWLGGDKCDKPRGWNKWFADSIGARSVVSLARSGATWTHTPTTKINTEENIGRIGPDNVITNQIERLVDGVRADGAVQPDVIIVACGTNDAWFPRERPNVLDLDAVTAVKQQQFTADRLCTLAGAMTADCRRLMAEFPTSEIIVLTPMQSTAFSAERLEAVTKVMVDVCELLGIKYLRQDTLCCIDSKKERVKKVMTTDGTHTSVLGARINGGRIARAVTELLNDKDNSPQ